ncbi:LysR family transcriptional regulator [Paenibacillus sp. BSR1-1]|uniref:LysR family transcriptional regulator n=1 Tax=Paenibacillus sp. BSR1-1 TaxID=3020845 RepID=UPI0025AF62A1|nr:LysR family transcriptional regulator [Paenibacillus sp. BSR1-1]MDN3016971.1 LysR family transcriptional regulator [Paenibacillus sp. BSR1-1]
MQIEQLEYVIEVAKAGTISTASKNLHVTQSAVSQSISSLEEELGVTLFHRSRTGTIPTDEGKKVIQKAYEIIMKIQELKFEMQSVKMVVKGELKLASIPTFMTFLLNPLSAFKGDFPNVNLEIKEQETQEVVDSVNQGNVDIGMIAIHEGLKDKTEDLEFIPLIKGEMKVYVPKNSPLAIYDTVRPHDLINQTIVMYDGDYVKWFVNNFLQQIGPLNILFKSNNTDVIRKAVLKSLAITFSPNWYPRNHELPLKDKIKMLHISNHHPVNMAFGLVYSKKRPLSASSAKFIKYVEKAFQTKDHFTN